VALVEDFVRLSMPLAYGDRLGLAAQPPGPEELSTYARFLEQALVTQGAAVEIRLGENHGVVHVSLAGGQAARSGTPTVNLGPQHSQWIYFDRNLLVSHENTYCLFKPLQRFWWTRARALADADQFRGGDATGVHMLR